jgi:RimJ/RimL family protein N-acetyltransferase
VRLLPYVRGAYPKDLLYRLWSLVAKDDAFHQLFWGLHLEESKHGDLEHFCRYFAEDSGRMLFVVQSVNKDEIAGFIWLDDVIPGFRGLGSVCMAQAYRGKSALEAVRLFCDYSFHELGLQTIWGVTPWPAASGLITHAGFERMAELPEFALVQGKTLDVRIFRLTKEQFYGVNI